MMGGSEKEFVSRCSEILRRHGLKKTSAAILRMTASKASRKIQDMCQPTEEELALA